MSDEDFSFCAFWFIIFLAIAGILGVNGSEKTINTIVDEPKIIEMVKSRELANPNPGGRWPENHRANVIKEFYTEEKKVDFSKTSVYVFLIFSGIPACWILVSIVRGFFSKIGIGDYFANKKKNDDARTKHYKKTLDDLIKLQEEISK